jgi:hypothetical protein
MNLDSGLMQLEPQSLLGLEKSLSSALKIKAARGSLIEFTEVTFPRYKPAPHHRIIAEQAELE